MEIADQQRGGAAGAIGAGQSEDAGVRGAGQFQRGGGGVDSGPRGEYVIDQENAAALNFIRQGGLETAAHVQAALAPRETRLGRRVPRAPQSAHHRDSQVARKFPSQDFGLIEAAPEAAAPVRRDGNEEIKELVARVGARHHFSKEPAEGQHAAVLEKVNQIAEPAIVGAAGPGALERGDPGRAQPAEAVFIQGARV